MDNLNESMDADQEHTFLRTRFSFHKRCKSEPSPSTSQTKRRTNYLTKFILCGNHGSLVKGCEKCLVFPVQEELPHGRLPSTKQVLGYLFWSHQKAEGDNIWNVAADVMLHWISLNVYTTAHKNVHKKLSKVFTDPESVQHFMKN